MLLLLLLGVIALEFVEGDPVAPLGHLAFLAGLCALSNALPVPAVNNVYLSMSAPIHVAIALILSPGHAAALVALSAVSNWELKRETTLSHAVFNRTQLAVSTAAASGIFGLGDRWAPSPAVVVVAAAAYQATNWILVAVAESTCRRKSLLGVLVNILPGSPIAAPLYVLLAITGAALGLTFLRVGPWAIAMIMLPLLAVRHTVEVARRLEEAERTGRALADRVITERDRERARIASDIHDVVLQDLIALQLQADNLVTASAMERDDLVPRLASTIRAASEQAILDLRRSIGRLRRTPVGDEGLRRALEDHVRSFAARTGIDGTVSATGSVDDLSPSIANLLYECAQEALNNVAKHARATTVTVEIHVDADRLRMLVADDGRGLRAATGGGGAGVALMRDKVGFIDGEVELTQRDSGGCELRIGVPLR